MWWETFEVVWEGHCQIRLVESFLVMQGVGEVLVIPAF